MAKKPKLPAKKQSLPAVPATTIMEFVSNYIIIKTTSFKKDSAIPSIKKE